MQRLASRVPLSNANKSALNFTIKELVGLRFRRTMEDVWNWDQQQFERSQQSKLQDSYRLAKLRVPFYRDRLEYPDSLASSQSLQEVLGYLPILEKAAVKSAGSEIWSQPLTHLTATHTTSGTSGTPLVIPASLAERSFYQAMQQSWWKHAMGGKPLRMLSLSGFMTPSAESGELYWQAKIRKSTFLSIYSLNAAKREAIRGLFASYKPTLIYGYASAVHEFSRLFQDAPLPGFENAVAIVTSEVLNPDWRRDIEGSICKRVFNYYSSQEGAHAVVECDRGNMHVHPLIGIVEILASDGTAALPGEIGDVVVTSLYKESMPLFRYRIGDTAVAREPNSACECGLKWPMIGEIYGRSEDLVITRDRRRIGYLCFHATKNIPAIREAQIIQTGFGVFKCVIVPVDLEAFPREHVEASIHNEVEKRTRESACIEFQYADRIQRGPNGKFKAVLVDMVESN